MCTVTIVRHVGETPDEPVVRVVCNRDERRSRPIALPPRVHDLDGVRAIYPIDLPSKGTWVAGNESGLIFALLNRNPRPSTEISESSPSRGTIIPSLLGCASLDEVACHANRLAGAGYAPFRLLTVGTRVLELTWDGARVADVWHELSQPLMFTSSSLGDERVEGPRRRLFEEIMQEDALGQHWQDAFHQHQWPDQKEISVRMERVDARTVSTTSVERRGTEIVMYYSDNSKVRLRVKRMVTS